PPIHAALQAPGHRHSRKRIARLLRHAGLRGCVPADSCPAPPTAARQLDSSSARPRLLEAAQALFAAAQTNHPKLQRVLGI
ncbi:MAG TPA: hypothetical protein P5038_07055, partial [Candidatus Paceibacterota bacterium]|nr:hypothetical protein [Candidatus Paceibacterota bacterium]